MKTLICILCCPNYFADMPREDKPGEWLACAIIDSPFRNGGEVETRKVSGLLNAYKTARWIALKADWRTLRNSDHYGIKWGVRESQPS